MKRFLCILTAAMVLIAAVAIAEGTAQPTAAPAEKTVEQKLYDMIPALDSFARNIGIEGEIPYDAASPDFVWTQLYLECVNWGASNPEITVTGAEMTVPAATLLKYAEASFQGMEALPEITGNIQYVRYDAQADAYIFQMSDGGVAQIVIEKYALDATGTLVVGFGLFNSESGERLGGFTAKLVAQTAGEDAFPYAVEDVTREAEGDFAGLAPTACAIRYEETAYPELSQGSKGDAVLALQERLNALGYDCGKADGVFGGATKEAVRYFQDALGVPQDGVASNAVQQALFAPDAPTFVQYVELKKNDAGIRVEKLQNRLRTLGYLAQPMDGAFGSRTEEAVKLFQKKAGLKADGIAGEKTLKALFAKNAPKCDTYITLKKGDTGNRVSEMQKQLKKLGFLNKKPSAVYDSDTVKAVKAFLAEIGETGDGKTADKALLKKLFNYEPAATPTAEPTAEPTPEPSVEPTAEPTPEPSAPVSVLTPAEQTAVTQAINDAQTPAPAVPYTDAEAVTWLQTALLMNPTTGVYDQATFDAVTLLQHTNSLPETGIADAAVIALLMAP